MLKGNASTLREAQLVASNSPQAQLAAKLFCYLILLLIL